MMLMFRMLESVPIGSLKNYMLVMNIYIYGASGISLIAKSTDIMKFCRDNLCICTVHSKLSSIYMDYFNPDWNLD